MSEWIGRQCSWLVVERLPGYAPELNPLEQAWGNLKSQELANLYLETIDDIADIAGDGLDAWQRRRALLRVFCTTADCDYDRLPSRCIPRAPQVVLLHRRGVVEDDGASPSG
jgi:hypothetical protein